MNSIKIWWTCGERLTPASGRYTCDQRLPFQHRVLAKPPAEAKERNRIFDDAGMSNCPEVYHGDALQCSLLAHGAIRKAINAINVHEPYERDAMSHYMP